MYKYACLNAISPKGLSCFDGNYEKSEDVKGADAILVRSANMHEMELDESVLAVARAGAGVNNIPLDDCAARGVVVFNTPGANANGVKEMVFAGMLLAARDVVGGVNWVSANADDENIAKTVEKQKKQYAGTEIAGKKLGVIGLGALGNMVANTAVALGMESGSCGPTCHRCGDDLQRMRLYYDPCTSDGCHQGNDQRGSDLHDEGECGHSEFRKRPSGG